MNLEQRLQKAESKGYVSVHVPSERCFFFVKSEGLAVGSVVTDCMDREYKVTKVYDKSRVEVVEA